MTGAWNFGGPGGFAIPQTTVTLDMPSDVSGDQIRGLIGQTAGGGELVFPVEPNGGIGDGAGPIPLGSPMPVEPDGGIGDGAGPIPLEDPMPVEPDGGIGDGAGPIPLEDPMPVEPDGGIGDGAGPIPDGEGETGADDGEVTIMPVEPDGGIGDGAGPIPDGEGETGADDGEVTIMPVEPDGGIGDGAGPIPDGEGETGADDGEVTIMPVEPDGGIGDGAGPIPDGEGETGADDGEVTIMPVEPGGGIGDGAGPPPDADIDPVEENIIEGGGEGTKADDTFIASEEADTFIFQAGHGNDTVHGFDVTEDRLDFSGTEIDFTDLESLLAHTFDQVDEGVVFGVYIETGEGTSVYLDGVSSADLASAMIDF